MSVLLRDNVFDEELDHPAVPHAALAHVPVDADATREHEGLEDEPATRPSLTSRACR